ncbi:hypothetical protein [Foetidibacter luteolus]|uniref:hypothetical protein n=1 Tax=Foetidibacter luteolus TaxID=2608880 RepID=UPI00129A87C7|nr:hypothetical protein [Foetidibacter luteolus]
MEKALHTGVRFFMAAQLRRNPFIGWFFMAAFQALVDEPGPPMQATKYYCGTESSAKRD